MSVFSSIYACVRAKIYEKNSCVHIEKRANNKSSNLGSLSIRWIRRKLLSGINVLHFFHPLSLLFRFLPVDAYTIKIITFSSVVNKERKKAI